ncbi:DUF3750 domain-containing protein [Halomonas sp.]|nr:DUF3750 domain-containing protein [Halomonas sp.]
MSDYPAPQAYRAWPGPNSNTFTAWVALKLPGVERLGMAPLVKGTGGG